MVCGGLDIGGTKIEARLFDAQLAPRDARRVPTPRDSADAFFAAVGQQVAWLREVSGHDIPVGISMTGMVEPATGLAHTVNLPISGEHMADRLTGVAGRSLPVINDSMALAFSEANGGAAEGSEYAVGLVLGTGAAAGFCVGGVPAPRFGGMAVEIGHSGMPGRALLRHGLGQWPCGCGRDGCIEAYVAGPAFPRLAERAGLPALTAPELSSRAAVGDTAADAVIAVWSDLVAEMLHVLQMTINPDVVVLGGGLSQMPGVAQRLALALPPLLMAGAPVPAIRLARFGDASGVRGAALLARMIDRGELKWTF